MILETVLLGSVAGIIANIATDSRDIFSRRLKEGLKSGSLPANHDMELAIRSACLRASRVVLDVIQTLKSPGSLPFLGHRADIKDFVKAADNFLIKQQKNTKSEDWYNKLPEFYAETLDKKVVDAAFAKFQGPMAHPTEMNKLAAIVLKEISDAIAIDCPTDVTEIFYDDTRGWPEAFRYCLGEELKTKERFRTIYMGFKINDLESRLIEQHEEIISHLQTGIDPDLARSIQKTLDGIEAKTDQILENQKEVNQFIEQHSDELESLRKEEKLSNRAIGQLLFEMGVMEEAPDRISEALKFAVHQYREIKRKLDRPTNTISPHKSLMNEARSVFAEGKIHQAREFIQRYNIKQAIWRQEQQEMFEQSAREQSEGLEMEGEFAISLRDVEGARDLYEQAATVLPASCTDEIQEILNKTFNIFHQFGTTFPSIFALNTGLYFINECLKNIEIEKNPQAWAAAQNNLGIILKDIGVRLFGEAATLQLEAAVTAHSAALTVYNKEDQPQDWAMIQNNLGITLQDIGTRLCGKAVALRLEAAITAYSAALTVYNKENFPQRWAAIQNNLGTALQDIGTRLSGEAATLRLEAAVEAYSAALTVRTKADQPQDWAMTQNNLGIVLNQIGVRLSGKTATLQLEAAVVAYSAALTVYSKEDQPQDWAITQNNMGTLLHTIGIRLSGEAATIQLETALAAYSAALTVYSKEDLPQDWAIAQNNMGAVLQDIGIRLSDEAAIIRFEEAIAAFSAALEVRTKEDLPQDWAMTQNNLGITLKDVGIRLSGGAAIIRLEEAIAANAAALTVYSKEDLPQGWAMTQNNLGIILNEIGVRLSGEAAILRLEEAVEVYSAVLTIYNKEDLPQDWAMAQSNLGIILKDIGVRLSGDAAIIRLEEAVAACSAALTVYTKEDLPQDWAMSRDNLGGALLEIGRLREDIELLKQALNIFSEVLDFFHNQDVTQHDESFEAKITKTAELINILAKNTPSGH